MTRPRLGVLLAVVALAALPARAQDGGDRTGVTDDTITIGVHAPSTGAAPFPTWWFAEGANLYWRYLHDDLGVLVHGRRVQVLVYDDQFSPTVAVSVCNQLAQQAFLLMGFIGTDQLNACAGFAEPRGIPYLFPGAQEAGLADRTTSYALSVTYPAQSAIISQFIVNRLGAAVDRYGGVRIVLPIVGPLSLPIGGSDGYVKVALVRQNTPNYNETEDALRSGLRALGRDLDEVVTVTKEGTSSEARSVASALQRDAVDVVVTTTSTTWTRELLLSVESNGYRPRFLSPGMTSNFDSLPKAVCRGADSVFDQASTFSPWPAWTDRDRFDPDFERAAATYAADSNVAGHGDVLLAAWGLMKVVHRLLDTAGTDPTRESFLTMLDAGYSQSTGVYPPLSFTAGDHFGADAVHRLEVDCSDALFHEADAFVTGYPAQ